MAYLAIKIEFWTLVRFIPNNFLIKHFTLIYWNILIQVQVEEHVHFRQPAG